jgi:hypothetical protein
MIPITKITGRLGNQMFQFATLFSKSLDEGTDYYFQDPKYFDKHRLEIKKLFGQGILPIDMVAIHVRRGDYVDNSFYIDLTKTEYYQRAMAEFPNEDFLLFSDDIEWCKKQEIFNDCEFSEYNNEIEAMNLMAGCKGIIMANSSFSWWASYLSKAKIIAPKEWFSDGVERTVCPKEWKRI